MMPNAELQNLINVVKKLPPPPVKFSIGEDITKTRCACGKVKPTAQMQVFNTGVVHAVDNICRGCEHLDKGLARIVCVRCRVVVARVSPHKDPIGFRFDAGRTYHTESCPVCDPSVENNRTLIIEQFLYHRERGRKL